MSLIGSPVAKSRTIARILRVNHAGEYGAIRIYRAQIFIARIFYPEISTVLSEMLCHEEKHRLQFEEAMPKRGARPCRLMWLWGGGGAVLGFVTAIMGRSAIWICTDAVERTVHRHLVDQLRFLDGVDSELHALISEIQIDEIAHLKIAESRVAKKSLLRQVIGSVVWASTEAVIWIATRGDSLRLARELARS